MKDRIKRLMESLHMNQQSFANYVGVAPATLNSILRERTRPTLDTLNAICKSMPNVNPLWLLNGSGNMFLADSSVQGALSGDQDGALSSAPGGSADTADASPTSPTSPTSPNPVQQFGRPGASVGSLAFTYDDDTPMSSAASGSIQSNVQPGMKRRQQQQSDNYADAVKKIDKPSRRITEIRVFYDDQTWESFVPKK